MSRYKLTINTCSINSQKNTSTEWGAIRRSIVDKFNSTCMYCGIKYKKYLICIHLDGNKKNNNEENLEICCKLCYSISNININGYDNFTIYKTSLDQVDINIKTVEYIKKYGRIPKSMKEFDKRAKLVHLSMFEYINELIYVKTRMPVPDAIIRLTPEPSFGTVPESSLGLVLGSGSDATMRSPIGSFSESPLDSGSDAIMGTSIGPFSETTMGTPIGPFSESLFDPSPNILRYRLLINNNFDINYLSDYICLFE